LSRSADRFCDFHGAVAAAIPTAWSGPALMVVFCVWIPLFPIGHHWALPAITLALSFTGFWSQLLRARIRETLAEGFADPARARGVPEWKVILKYGLAPAAGALAAYLGTQIGALLGGAFITEYIFDWRGMGTLLIDSVLKRDYPIVEAAVFFTAFFSLLGTALGDWAQSVLEVGK
jgi:ABC-type dipeptide/oligopeptide/nickel transport system permease component